MERQQLHNGGVSRQDRGGMRHGLIKEPSRDEACICLSGKQYEDCCLLELVLPRQRKDGMFFLEIGGIEIYRSSPASDTNIRSKIEPALKAKFPPGVYTKPDDVREVLFKQVEIFGDLFDSLIGKLASREFLEFLLWQYDRCGELDQKVHNGVIHGDAAHKWAELGPSHKRTLKYICERITMLAPDEGWSEHQMPTAALLDEVFICAEELVQYCITSDLSRLFPEHTTVIVHPAESPLYIEHTIDHPEFPTDFRFEFLKRINADNKARSEIFKDSDPFKDHKLIGSFLDIPLKDTIGASWEEVLQILRYIMESCRPAPGCPMGTKFILRKPLVDNLAEAFKKPATSIERVLDGLTLSPKELAKRAKGDTDFWNPNFEERAYRKVFFSMPHSLGQHLAFGDRVLHEGVVFLSKELAFGKFPKEWRSPSVDKALGQITTERGKWFESEVERLLAIVGLQGVSSRQSIGSGRSVITTPGELDYIGWSPKDAALVLFEDKMLLPATEPKQWGSQLNAFLVGDKRNEAFVPKFKRKIAWVKENSESVTQALKSESIRIDTPPQKVISAFITYAPFALAGLLDVPCFALTELLRSYEHETVGPFNSGITNIPSADKTV
jgi:hypothetical protein